MNRNQLIKETYKVLKENNLNFVNLRNFDLIFSDTESDIDVLIDESDANKLNEVMKLFGYKKYIDKGIICLYNAKTHMHFINQQLQVHFDIVTGLFYRSLDMGQYVPIDQQLQKQILQNKIKVHKPWIYQPSPEDEIIHLCCHAIFDKKTVSERYCQRISVLFEICDKPLLRKGLSLCFFKFAPKAFELMEKKSISNLYNNYIKFREY